MQAHEPDLWLHFMSHEIQPLRLVFRWMMRGFSGHLPPEQLLYLWDLVIAHDSMEVNLHVKRLILNAFSKLLLHRFLQSCYNVSAIFSHPCQCCILTKYKLTGNKFELLWQQVSLRTSSKLNLVANQLQKKEGRRVLLN